MSEDKKQAILKATLKLISERGFHDTPMSLIAKKAGVSVGIIYHYFQNKEELIHELYRSQKIKITKIMLDDVAASSDSIDLFFMKMWLRTVQYYKEHPYETNFMEQYAHSPLLKQDFEAEYYEIIKPLIIIIEKAVEEGKIKPIPLELLVSLTFEVGIALAKKHITGVLDLTDEVMNLAAHACWDAIRQQ
jgi:AcrR family transcriptional regulator